MYMKPVINRVKLGMKRIIIVEPKINLDPNNHDPNFNKHYSLTEVSGGGRPPLASEKE